MYLLKLVDKFHTFTYSLIKDRFPKLSLYYYVRPRLFFYWRKQPIHALVKGKLKIDSDKKSVLFFTVHKSASVFMTGFMEDLGRQTDLVHIDYTGYFTSKDAAKRETLNDPRLLKKVFKNTGCLYGPLRFYLDIEGIKNYPIILLLRDPRDVLTSHYFSVKKTHPLVTAKYIERRKAAQGLSIDEFVKAEADKFLKTYTAYAEKLVGNENVLFLKYEDMICDFNLFVKRIDAHLELKLTKEQFKQLDRSSEFIQGAEDPTKHKRKVMSGDHKEKLQLETIVWLNEKFETVLKKLNYPFI